MITGVHHFALTVGDADRAIAFYGLFGMEVASDREVERDYVEVITGVEGAHLRLVHLLGHGVRLELIQYLHPTGRERAAALPDVGSAHACFITDDLDEELARLSEHDISMQSREPVTTTSGPNRGGRGVYLLDPDGNVVEVVQLGPGTAV